eukprot:Skav213393  [mRNA]  locus=scaffold797:451795:453958:+ [translate_table: standard]
MMMKMTNMNFSEGHASSKGITSGHSSPFIRTKSVNMESGTLLKWCLAESGTSSISEVSRTMRVVIMADA